MPGNLVKKKSIYRLKNKAKQSNQWYCWDKKANLQSANSKRSQALYSTIENVQSSVSI